MLGTKSNTMIYESIHGWFDFQGLYKHMVEKHREGVFVEIGTWLGRSTCFMAELIKDSGKPIKFYAIDSFDMSLGNDHYPHIEGMGITDFYGTYLKNIDPLKGYIRTIKGDSLVVHELFEEGSIDFLFIDGNHTYDHVQKELEFWIPKIKKGGAIAGHDYFEGVKRAVDERFIDIQTINTVWLVNL
jgi:predicted O-methyltransferase YrrM